MSTQLRAMVQIALLGALLAGCSFLGFRPTPSPPTPTTEPVPTTAAATTPAETIAVATAETGTIYPETFNPYATPTPVPPATPFPTAQPAGMAGLIYGLVGQLGKPDWCDPDFYPVARADELELAKQHLAEIQADAQMYQQILAHNGISSQAQLTDDQLVAIYRDWKVLTKAIVLTPTADGYSFDYVALRGPDGQQTDFHVAGQIDASGKITTTTDEATSAPNCPICLARGTLIGAPGGSIPVEQLAPGMDVWTTNELGGRVAADILAVGSTPVPPSHQVVHLVLADGRVLEVSPGHPLADGRLAGSLAAGDPVDGSVVVTADLVDYTGGATFDLLPAGPTGDYWANGILMGSTLTAR